MSDPITQRIAQHTTDQVGQQAGPRPLGQVNPEDQEKFEEALNPQASEENGAQQDHVTLNELQSRGDGTATGIVMAEGVSPANHVEHEIVKEASELEKSFSLMENKVSENTLQATTDLSPMELLKTQVQLVKTETQLQFTTKVADKVGTDIQTLANRQN